MENQYNWERFWCPREGNFSLSERGFLADPDSEYGNIYNPQAKRIIELNEIRCLILLGEPGIGKSDEINKHAITLRSINNQCLDFELRDFQTDLKLAQDVFDNNPTFQNWLESNDELYLLLDSLDEGLLSIQNLSSVLLKELRKHPVEKIKLRITCRTAEWSSFLEDELQKLWGPDNVKAFELLPLREKDIAEACNQENIDSQKFIDDLVRKEVVPLALKPVTLKMLLDIYRGSGQFPQSQADLYLQGCKLLCEETNKSRSNSIPKANLSAERKLNIAARIAAVCRFSNRAAIWTGSIINSVPDTDVSLAELCGGIEASKGLKFTVEESEILLTLATGLFTSRGLNRMGWAHQTYAEFLAAYYLKLHNVSLEQQNNLLTSSSGDDKVVPQLYETAGWMASLNHLMFREITKTDPSVLLRSDVATVDEKDRILLVDELLGAANNDALLLDNKEVYYRFHKLKHFSLASQLEPYILNKGNSPLARRLATDIGEACELEELQNSLIKLVLDKEETLPLRENAAYAIIRIADKPTKAKLKNFITKSNEDDSEDNLRGCAFRALYPDQLSAKELFKGLTYPKRSNYLGAYKSFLYTDFSEYLDETGIIEGLRWIRKNNIVPHHTSPFTETRKSVLKAAWHKVENAEILKELALSIAANLRLDYEDPDDIIINEKSRRTVLSALIPLFPQIKDHVFWLIYHRPHLVQQSDFHWLLDRFAIEKSAKIKEGLLELIQRIFNIQDIKHIESIMLASQNSPAIAKAFVWWLKPVVLNSPQAETLRKQHEQIKRLNNRSDDEETTVLLDPLPTERIDQYLEKFEAGDLSAWWRLNMEMTLEPNSQHYGHDDQSDLLKSPGWQKATPEIKQRIINAARKYVLDAFPEEDKWLGKNRIYRPAYAGYRALRLLSTEDPQFIEQLSAKYWQKWAAIILAFPYQSSEDDRKFQKDMMRLAYENAPSEITNAALIKIGEENKRDKSLYFLSILEDCWEGELLDKMTLKVQDETLEPVCMGQILSELLSHDVSEAKSFAEKLVTNATRSEDERSLIAARELILNADNKGWETVWKKVEQDTEFGRKVIQSAAHSRSRRDISILAKLSEKQLSHLYIWLVRQYPHKDDPVHDGSFWVGEPDSARELRDSVLRHLTQRGTFNAIAALKEIQAALPELEWIKWTVLEAQNETRRLTWKPYDPEAILKITGDNQLRLVQSGEQLLDVIIESLQRLELKLHGETPAAIDLWNEIAKGKYRPKDENRLSDYIKRHLDEDLRGKAIIANREVEIRRGTGKSKGERTDIHIDAILKDKSGEAYDQITAIIETKGCWNRDLWQAMETQLKNRYLKDSKYLYGLYLVGNFECSEWDTDDSRRKQSPKLTNSKVIKKLEDQAHSLSEQGILIKSFVLDASL